MREGGELRELVGAPVVVFPEIRLLVGKHALRAGDRLDHDGHARAELSPARREGFPIDEALADGGPLHGRALRGVPNLLVAERGADRDRPERLERIQRVFEGPGSVARVEIAADEIGAGGFDELAAFPRVQVATVIFHGDLDAGVEGVAATGLQHGHSVGNARLDTAFSFPVGHAAEQGAENG